MAAFNQAAADALGLSLSDIGQAPRDIAVLARLPRLEQHCSKVVTGGVESRMEFRDKEAWFVLRIFPYTTGHDQVSGTVLTFTNVTALPRQHRSGHLRTRMHKSDLEHGR